MTQIKQKQNQEERLDWWLSMGRVVGEGWIQILGLVDIIDKQ